MSSPHGRRIPAKPLDSGRLHGRRPGYNGIDQAIVPGAVGGYEVAQ